MKFEAIKGYENIKKKLILTIANGRMPHAQLFLGIEGGGQLAMALAYAQYAICLNPSNEDSCGKCSNCVKMEKMIHPDLHFSYPMSGGGAVAENQMLLFKKSLAENPYMSIHDWMSISGKENGLPNITSAECRSIIHKLSFKPFEASIKILIMWLPEYLNVTGNILLKSIEEPSGKTLLLLVSNQEEKILGTILSRTQKTRFPPFKVSEIKEYMLANYEMTEDVAQNIGLMSGGDLNKAINLSENVENAFLDSFRGWLLDCYKGDKTRFDYWTKELSGLGREKIKSFFDYGLQMCRACLVEPYGLNKDRLTHNENDFVKKLAALMDIDNIATFYKLISDASYGIERNGNAKIIIIDLSLNIRKCFKSKKLV